MESTVPNFEKQRILVSGGAGFVGANLVKALLRSNPEQVVAVDNLLSAEKENLPDDKRVKFIQGSIADDTVLNQFGDELDYVFHLATYHGNQSSIHDPIADHANNTITTLKVMNHCKNFKRIKKLVYSAAGCAAAEKTFSDAQATDEDAPLSLIQDSPYSISKVVGEYYAVYFNRQHNLPTVRARFQNVYGPGEVLGAGAWRGTPATVWRNVTPTFIYRALKRMQLPLENEGLGSRDFIFVEDIVQGLLRCAVNGKPGDVYNLASGVETTVRELATIINEFTGNTAGVELKPRRPWDHSGKRFGSTEKSEKVLGFKAAMPLRKGLEQTIAWTKANLEFIEICIRKHDENMKRATA